MPTYTPTGLFDQFRNGYLIDRLSPHSLQPHSFDRPIGSLYSRMNDKVLFSSLRLQRGPLGTDGDRLFVYSIFL